MTQYTNDFLKARLTEIENKRDDIRDRLKLERNFHIRIRLTGELVRTLRETESINAQIKGV